MLKDLSLCSKSKLIFCSIIWQFFSCIAIKFIFSILEIIYRPTIDSYYSSGAFDKRLMSKVWKRLLSRSFILHYSGFRFFRLKYFPRSKLLSKTSLMSLTTSISFLLLESVVWECASIFLLLRADRGLWLIDDFGFWCSKSSIYSSESKLDLSRLICVGVPFEAIRFLVAIICLIFSWTSCVFDLSYINFIYN